MSELLDHPALSSAYFFPRRHPVENPFVVHTADGQATLACYRSAPFTEALTVLHFHGNAEVVADYVPGVASLINGLGVNVVFAEYRGYGASTGRPSLGKMLDDVAVIVEAVGVEERSLVPFGRSLGSVFAIETCVRYPHIAGLVIESGIADPLERALLRVSPEDLGTSQAELERVVHARLDHERKLASYGGPLLVMHTTEDALVPVSHGTRILSWAASAPADKEIVLFDHGDHGTIFPANRDAYLSHLAALLSKAADPRRTEKRLAR